MTNFNQRLTSHTELIIEAEAQKGWALLVFYLNSLQPSSRQDK